MTDSSRITAGIVSVVNSEKDERLAALIYFTAAIRAQFYFDGNKRTARMMASGLLMKHGYEALYIPFERRLEYNRRLGMAYLSSLCLPSPSPFAVLGQMR